MSYERKIFLYLLLAIAAFLPLVGVSVFTLRKVIAEENTVIENDSKKALLIERLQFFNASRNLQFPVYLLTKEQRHIDMFQDFNQHFNDTLNELIAMDRDAVERNSLIELKKRSDKVYPYFESGFNLRASGKDAESVNHFFQTTAVPANGEIRKIGQELATKASLNVTEARKRLETTIRHLEETIGLLTIFAILLTVWVAFLIRNLSRQKRLADQSTARISQARKEIVEVVAHDLKNPLTGILMSNEVALTMYPPPEGNEELLECLRMTGRSAQSMKRLIDALLDHAKIESGSLVMEKEICDVNLFLEDIFSRFALIAKSKKINFKKEVPANLPTLLLDPMRTDQVISNLLGNALKFTPAGGVVAIGAKFDDHQLTISVSDTGAGIAKEQTAHVFDRYWQVRETANQGTGLGLSIAKEIIRAHEGKIWVESEVGKGSTFAFSIPLP